MSNVSGAWTGTVGCNDESSFHALKRTPATNSPDRPVDVSGTSRPLQVTTWLSFLKLQNLSCSRSTEDLTKRTVAPALPSSPSTYQGSIAWRNSSSTPP